MNPCWSEFSGCETRRSDGRRKRTTHIRLSGGAVDPAHRNHLEPHHMDGGAGQTPHHAKQGPRHQSTAGKAGADFAPSRRPGSSLGPLFMG